MTDDAPKPIPVSLRPDVERYAHVVLRLKERGNLDWTPEQVAKLESKIKFVRQRINQMLPVAPILPMKIGEEKEGAVHFYRVLIATQPHVFVWSQIARGLISYIGLSKPPPHAEVNRVIDCRPGGDLSGCTDGSERT